VLITASSEFVNVAARRCADSGGAVFGITKERGAADGGGFPPFNATSLPVTEADGVFGAAGGPVATCCCEGGCGKNGGAIGRYGLLRYN
jgi:hypothetical protein